MKSYEIIRKNCLEKYVNDTVDNTFVYDIHTHLFPASFNSMSLAGINELLTYHYLEAELFKTDIIKPEKYFQLRKQEKANIIWNELFLSHTPISEATVGVLTVLKKLGFDGTKNLDTIRRKFDYLLDDKPEKYIETIMNASRVKEIVMTNDPFDKKEIDCWLANCPVERYFKSSLRLDGIFNNVEHEYNGKICKLNNEDALLHIKEMIKYYIDLMNPVYLSLSLPDTFTYNNDDFSTKILNESIFRIAEEYDIPVSLMIGVRRGVNRNYSLAGDGVGQFDIRHLENICRSNPNINFLVSLLSRENQYELCVLSRKFKNLTVFGVWWFLNNPLFIDEITRMRLYELGFSFIPQHSDARVFEQLIYKWDHFRDVLKKILVQNYRRVLENNWDISKQSIKRDVENLLFNNAYRKIVGGR